MIIEVRGYICSICKDIVYSRASHDCIECTCGAIFMDGGPCIVGDSSGYHRTKGNPTPTTVKLDDFSSILEAKSILVQDYNQRTNKYGRVKG